MDGVDKLFGGAIVVIVLVNVAWWSFVGYVAYRILSHFGIL